MANLWIVFCLWSSYISLSIHSTNIAKERIKRRSIKKGDCSDCVDNTAETVSNLQDQWQYFINSCDLQNASFLMTRGFSFTNIDLLCKDPSKCCVLNGNSSQFLSQYNCGTNYFYISQIIQNVRTLPNGTLIVSLFQQNLRSDTVPLKIYHYDYYWKPSFSCSYMLDYINGYNFECPSFRYNLTSCNSTLCTS